MGTPCSIDMFNLLRKVKRGQIIFVLFLLYKISSKRMPPHQIKFKRVAIELNLVKRIYFYGCGASRYVQPEEAKKNRPLCDIVGTVPEDD